MTNTPIFCFSITSGEDVFQDKIALLVTLQDCSQQHVHFKPLSTTALPYFSPIGAMAMSGDVNPYGGSTDTPVTSLRITSGEDIFQANIALLFAP